MDKTARMKELIAILNEASRAYYAQDREIMSNYEYDALYDELKGLEEELGTVMASSPTVNVGYEVLSELPKERHESPMLSLDKTKEVARLKEFVGDQMAVISWKMDGLTIVLTYRDGELFKAVTRGNGEVGEVITNNAKVFKNVPLHIPYKGELILRGEAVIGYKDFERINEEIADVDAKYKNPRNLCSGSVRQLNNKITAQRNVKFYAFTLVRAENVDFHNSRKEQLDWLEHQGFDVVEHYLVTREELDEKVAFFAEKIVENDFPSDGLVLVYDDIAYGQSLGRTAKFPRDSFAFKWADEIRETHLLEIEWSPSRTGLINPVAIFEPVELEGTTVSRASVHNLSIMEELHLGIGDTIEVYKANMIIPQIAKNLTGSDNIEIPKVCPVCGGATEIRQMNDAKSLYCTNPMCQAKRIKSFALFVSRDALNIDGLSEATLEKFIARGFIHKYRDIFHLDSYQEEIQTMEGFGEKSYANLIASVDKARSTTLAKVVSNKSIRQSAYDDIFDKMRNIVYQFRSEAYHFNLLQNNKGNFAVCALKVSELNQKYFISEERKKEFKLLLGELEIQPEEMAEEQKFAGMSFVVTGSVNHFANRNEVKELVEKMGGKVTGSVTKKTNYLINNDVESASSKNRKAKELGVPIISEEEFIELAGVEIE